MTRPLCNFLLLVLSLTIICLTSAINAVQPPSDLCIHSPNPPSCHALVSNALNLSKNPTPLAVFKSVITTALRQLNTTTDELRRQIRDDCSSSLVNCVHLMDLSSDRLTASATAATNGAHTNARTWLSAVLTNHATCLDGLGGQTRSGLTFQLRALMDSASASLAILNAVPPSSSSQQQDDVLEPTLHFPSWVSSHDQKLLSAAANSIGIAADAVVAQDGTGHYTKVQDAVNAAPGAGNVDRYIIYVKKGLYLENVYIGKMKTNLMIMGDGMDASIISGSLNAVDGSNTFTSATLAVEGDGVILQDLKIENTAGPAKHQAVALRVLADRSAINRCKIEAYQDTLYAHSYRQFYRDSSISGTVDFIFGNAATVIQNCLIVSRKPLPNQKNTVTAQGRKDPNQNTGISLQNCQFVPAADLFPGSVKSYLGRPWQRYSRTVVMQSSIGSHIDPAGWLEWEGNPEFSKTVFYGEYQNRGPGANTTGRVKWPGFMVITDPSLAGPFTVGGLIQGGSWLKDTGVPFNEGL